MGNIRIAPNTRQPWEDDDEPVVQNAPQERNQPVTQPAPKNNAPKVEATTKVRKVAITIRLDPDIVAFFEKDGPGWQSRINLALKEWVDRSG